jgi:hypothetical protein
LTKIEQLRLAPNSVLSLEKIELLAANGAVLTKLVNSCIVANPSLTGVTKGLTVIRERSAT